MHHQPDANPLESEPARRNPGSHNLPVAPATRQTYRTPVTPRGFSSAVYLYLTFPYTSPHTRACRPQVLTVHMLYLLRMYLRARRAVAKVGSAEPPGAQPEAPKKAFGLYAAFCGDPSFSVFKLWPVPEVLVTLQFLSGLMSTSIKSLSAAVYAECCVPFACWLPILVLLYILCFILYIANKLRKFAVSCAPHVAIPAAERTAASGAFRTETASTPAERARVDRERTRKISLDPFRFGAVGEMEVTLGVTTFAAKLTRKASMTRKKARVGDVGQRSRVARPGSPGQESGFASPPPSPPSGTTVANPVQQAMDAAYALYYIWIGDARPGCERYALVAVVHSLVIVLVQSTCPLCGGSSSTNVQLTIVLVLQLVAIVAYLKVRPTAIGCSSVTLGITWLLEACATACYMSLPKPGDHPGFNMAELSAEFTPSPYLPPPPSAPPPPNSPPPPGAPPDPPFFPPPPAAPPPLFPLPCTSQWEAMCAQVASNISALVYTVTGDAVNLNEICSATSSDNCSVEPPSFSLGDLGFAFQLASTGITWSLLIILPSWPKIAPYLPKSTPKKEAPVEPPKEVKVKEAKKPKEEKSKEAKPPKEEKPKKVKKVKKVASAATLVEVAKEADQKLAQLGLTKVQVDLMARRLTLAESLEFQGSKSEGGAGAFKDHDAAHKVCHEVAIALKTCNDILRERGFATFGLSGRAPSL